MNKTLTTAIIAAVMAAIAFKNIPNENTNVTISRDIWLKFNAWKSQTNKIYATPNELHYRFKVFSHNFIVIRRLQDTVSYKVGLNDFSDLTDEEFLTKYTGDLNEEQFKNLGSEAEEIENLQQAPSHVDWREKGAVNPIQNQGQCGSCWAFAATASFETAYWKSQSSGLGQQPTKLRKFSEQVLVDCNTKNHGCGGGNADLAFEYLRDNGTTDLSNYPYVARDQACKQYTPTAKSTGFRYKTPSSKMDLLSAVFSCTTYVSVFVNDGFRHYQSGVFEDNTCSQTQTNHGVGIVGYNMGNGLGQQPVQKNYFILRNSWGTSWGQNGYMNIVMSNDAKGQCYLYRRMGYATF